MTDSEREAVRQKALAEIALLNTPPEREFDTLANLAQRMLGTRMASVTLIDPERQWFKARCGLLAPWTDRGPALCTAVFETEAPVTVADASLDPRFADSPFVAGEPHIRFYAGVPVGVRQVDGDHVTIGTLCVLDDKPRAPTEEDLRVLSELACLAEALIEARAVALRAAEAAEQHRAAVERLERERRQFRQAEQMADMGSWRLGLADNRVEWSEGVYAIHEMEGGPVPALDKALDFYKQPDRDVLAAKVANTVETGEPFEMDADFVTAKGRWRRVRVSCEIELSRGKPVALIGVIQDVSDRHLMEETLRRQARTDSLTGLANRAEFQLVIDTRLREARSAGNELAVLLIDLDGFKGVNDALGHAAGDDVLREVADRLRQSCYEGWLPARLGGDEFAVVVPSGMTYDSLAPMVDRLLRDLDIVTSVAGHIARVTATVGIAWSGAADDHADVLLRRADSALYAAKRTCKGTAQTYRSSEFAVELAG